MSTTRKVIGKGSVPATSSTCPTGKIELSVSPNTSITARHPGPVATEVRRDRLKRNNEELRKENKALRTLLTDTIINSEQAALAGVHLTGSTVSSSSSTVPTATTVPRLPLALFPLATSSKEMARRLSSESRRLKELEASMYTLQNRRSKLKLQSDTLRSDVAILDQQARQLGSTNIPDVEMARLQTNRQISRLNLAASTKTYPREALAQRANLLREEFQLTQRTAERINNDRARVQSQLTNSRQMLNSLETQLQEAESSLRASDAYVGVIRQQVAYYRSQIPTKKRVSRSPSPIRSSAPSPTRSSASSLTSRGRSMSRSRSRSRSMSRSS